MQRGRGSDGVWPQTNLFDRGVCGLNADGKGSLNCSWLEMDRVDPWRPTQSRNVSVTTMRRGNEQWKGTVSGSSHPIFVSDDESIQVGEHNVNVGLTLQGRFY